MPIRLKLSERGKVIPDCTDEETAPPSGVLEIPKKFELPPTHPKDSRKAPSKKSRTTIKKEKPRPVITKVHGAVLWRDCPVEVISSAKANLISGAIPVLVDIVASVKSPPSLNEADSPSNEKMQLRRTTGPAVSRRVSNKRKMK